MIARLLLVVVVLAVLAVGGIWVLGKGLLVTPHDAGTPTETPIPEGVLAGRAADQRAAATAAGASDESQILFGDLHVHTTYSFDAFAMSLPIAGGDGAHPVADACDFARYCSALDFWSITDHGLALTPERWSQTIDGMRQCNAVAGDPASPDVVGFLGWEWTQVGTTPEKHWGHKNVILRNLDDDRIPTRPIASYPPLAPGQAIAPSTLALGLYALAQREGGGMEFARYLQDMGGVPLCPEGVPVRELPDDCRERARTPRDLFAKLDEWGHEALVIPHGSTWGFYTPPGSSWDKQLTPEQHDPRWQRIIEIFSGHGNSEEYRDWREVTFNADGTRSCPEPRGGYVPTCWRAGEVIAERCAAAGLDEATCRERAADARRNFVAADFNAGAATVPGWTVEDRLDAGQCTDCFQPAFNYRPRNSVQYIMALGRGPSADPLRFRFGFIASSDNHSARPGTGYKEFSRSELTEQRFGYFPRTPLAQKPPREPEPVSEPYDPEVGPFLFAAFETERQASFFLNGGLVAVHAPRRHRDAIYESLTRKEIYGTSGPRILLWFDLLDPPGGGDRLPMGGAVRTAEAPRFEVRAVGSFEQSEGCPDYSTGALTPERLQRLCQGECYHPSDERRRITRIEVVRIRPQVQPDEQVAALVEDPWRVFPCDPDPAGCRVVFADPEFPGAGRDALYYARAIEAPSLAVAADPLRCERDGEGRCLRVRPCFSEPLEDECLSETEERAWSSPIFVDFAR